MADKHKIEGDGYVTHVHVDGHTDIEISSEQDGWVVNLWVDGQGWRELARGNYYTRDTGHE